MVSNHALQYTLNVLVLLLVLGNTTLDRQKHDPETKRTRVRGSSLLESESPSGWLCEEQEEEREEI